MTDQPFRDALSEDLIRDEGIRLKPYRCTAGKLTIGIGRNIEDNGITEAEALYLLSNDIARISIEMDRALPWWIKLPEPCQRALLNMAFQLGTPKLLGFRKMLAALERGDRVEAAAEASESLWAKQVPARAARVTALLRG